MDNTTYKTKTKTNGFVTATMRLSHEMYIVKVNGRFGSEEIEVFLRRNEANKFFRDSLKN